jgi:hypothetical protein
MRPRAGLLNDVDVVVLVVAAARDQQGRRL